MNRKILIVEDEPLAALDIEQTIFEVSDAGVETAGNVADALQLLDTDTFAAVILDGNLHGESSEDIANRLKQSGIPFLIVSGYSRAQLGFIDDETPLLEKPFSVRNLTKSIKDLLNMGEKPS